MATTFRVALVVVSVVLVAAAVTAAVIFWPSPPEGGTKNVLLIMVDDLRPELGVYMDHAQGYTPYYSGIRTPHIDALAGRSLVFTNAYCQYALCNPSRASLLTSRRPDTTKVYGNSRFFRDVNANLTTLPQLFKESGYLSVGMGKVFHFRQFDPISWSDTDMPYVDVPDNNDYQSQNLSWRAVSVEEEARFPLPDQELRTLAIDALKNASDGEKPFFVMVGFLKPHLPFTAPQRYFDMYPEENISLAVNNFVPENLPPQAWFDYVELRRYKDITALNVTGDMGTTLPDFKAMELRRAYYASVSYVDGLVGEVLAELSRLGLDDNTVVALMGDHGWMLGDHSGWCKYNNFDVSTRTVLMLSTPDKQSAGETSSRPIELVDLYPTMVEAAGLPQVPPCPSDSSESSAIATCTEGSSLMPLVRQGDAAPWKEAAFTQMQAHEEDMMGYSVRTSRYRYTEFFTFSMQTGADWGTVHAAELYDYEADPQGNHNVAHEPEYSEQRAALRAKLRAGWIAERENIKQTDNTK